MSIIFFLVWLVATLGLCAWVLHSMGEVYGAHVPTQLETRLVALFSIGSVVWIVMSAIRWLLP